MPYNSLSRRSYKGRVRPTAKLGERAPCVKCFIWSYKTDMYETTVTLPTGEQAMKWAHYNGKCFER